MTFGRRCEEGAVYSHCRHYLCVTKCTQRARRRDARACAERSHSVEQQWGHSREKGLSLQGQRSPPRQLCVSAQGPRPTLGRRRASRGRACAPDRL